MRYMYPRNWFFMTTEEKNEWWRTEGQRQFEEHKKAEKEFAEYIKSGKFKKEQEDLPF